MSHDDSSNKKPPLLRCEKHAAPPGVNYDENPTVFGKVLNGTLPAKTMVESNDLLAFADRSPRAPLHALVIPKRHVSNINHLTPNDMPLLQDIQAMAMELIRQEHPQAFDAKDYILCFHCPPFHLVDHLHLHVLAPASEIVFPYNWIFCKNQTLWCTSIETVLKRLDNGK